LKDLLVKAIALDILENRITFEGIIDKIKDEILLTKAKNFLMKS
jgi:hypothetical protein